MKNNIKFHVRFPGSIDNISEALKQINTLQPHLSGLHPQPKLEVGYHIPQPIYKSWVPSWLIRLITSTPSEL